jgi:hypothetical protein
MALFGSQGIGPGNKLDLLVIKYTVSLEEVSQAVELSNQFQTFHAIRTLRNG